MLFLQSRAFIAHPLRKIRAANVLFYQSRVFYRTSVALGCAGLLYAAMGWGRLLRAAPGCFGPLLVVLGCAKLLWVVLGSSGLLCGLLWERPGKMRSQQKSISEYRS